MLGLVGDSIVRLAAVLYCLVTLKLEDSYVKDLLFVWSTGVCLLSTDWIMIYSHHVITITPVMVGSI